MHTDKYCVYKLSSPSGKCYIGMTKNIGNRLSQHRALTQPSTRLMIEEAGGWNNITASVLLENLSRDEARIREADLIQQEAEVGLVGNIIVVDPRNVGCGRKHGQRRWRDNKRKQDYLDKEKERVEGIIESDNVPTDAWFDSGGAWKLLEEATHCPFTSLPYDYYQDSMAAPMIVRYYTFRNLGYTKHTTKVMSRAAGFMFENLNLAVFDEKFLSVVDEHEDINNKVNNRSTKSRGQ